MLRRAWYSRLGNGAFSIMTQMAIVSRGLEARMSVATCSGGGLPSQPMSDNSRGLEARCQ
jgi:hypothetical protein